MTWTMFILLCMAVVVGILLLFVIWYGRRNPKETEENKKIYSDVEKALANGNLSEDDAQIIKKTIE